MSEHKRSPSGTSSARVKKDPQRGGPSQRSGAAVKGRGSWTMITIAGVVVAAFVGLVVVSATRSTSKNANGAGAGAVSAAPTGGAGVGGRVAPLRLENIAGGAVSLPKPGRPGALFFSVSGCTACIPSAQALGTLIKSRLGSRADAVYISMDPQDSPQFMRERRASIGDPPYPFAIDRSGELVTQYRVQQLGTVVIYDARGRIVARMVEPSLRQLADGFRKAGVA